MSDNYGFFPQGQPLRGYRPPVPSPEVYLPHQAPYFYNPFMPYFVAPNYIPPYIKNKDLRALEGLGSRALVSVASSAPDRGQSPYAQYLDRPRYSHVSEAWGGDFDDDLFGGDDDDILGDLFGDDDILGDLFDDDDDDFGAKGPKKRPFKLLSELFKKMPGKSKSKAQELIDAAAALTQQPVQPSIQIQEPKSEWSMTAKVAVGVGATAVILALGVFAGRTLQAR